MSYSPNELKAFGQKGDEYNKTSWSDLTDFVTNSMSATVSSSKIQIPDANVSDFSKALQLNKYVCCNNWKMIIIFKRTASPSGGGSGISIGIQSTNSDQYNSSIVYMAGSGTLQFFYQNGSSTYSTDGILSSALSYSNSHLIRLSIERENQKLTFTAENLNIASNAPIVLTKTLSLTGVPPANTGQWCIWAQGGTFEVEQIQCINKEILEPNTLFVGDSKIMGFGVSGDYGNTVTGILKKYYGGISVSAGFGDKSGDILNNLSNLVALRPKNVVLAFGSNDVRFSEYASFLTNYATIRAAFVAIGANILDVSPMYESGGGLDTQKADFISAYPNCLYVYDDVRRYGLYGDGIHLVDATHAMLALRIIDSNLLNYRINSPEIDISIPNSSSSQDGLLTSTDWNTFNNKAEKSSFAALSSDFTTTSTTVTDVGLATSTLIAGHSYKITWVLYTACSTANGLLLNVANTGTMTSYGAMANGTAANITQTKNVKYSLPGSIGTFNTVANDGIVRVEMIVTVTADGIVSMRMKSNTSGDTSTVYAGSTVFIEPIN